MKLEELSRLLREVDPAAVLVPAPVLERVIQNVTESSWAVWRVPHRQSFLVDRYALFSQVEQEELYLPPDHRLPDTVLLLERPTADQLTVPRLEILTRYWRLLFHISVHRELAERLPQTDAAALNRRLDTLGSAVFEEARNVLDQDYFLSAHADDREVYIEFAATFLELQYFSPNLIPVYFPSLAPIADVEQLLSEDIDAAALFERTRLGGIPNPIPKTDDQTDESHDYFHRLERGAQRASENGDTIGAAILYTRAARVAPAAFTEPALAGARQEIFRLIDRLHPVLALTDAEVAEWRKVLPALLDKADQGTRPVEAAILFDLQRVCLDYEQKIYTLDVAEWMLSGGHRPIRRELDSQRFIRVPGHLRAAVRRLTAARLTDADRQALGELLKNAVDHSEEQLRARFRPTLTDALTDAGLRAASVPEQAALAKTVEELLDRVSATGILSFADVRDAIARGQLKMPDLTGPHEYLRGDPLLRLDRRLATLMDGVYRRGEFYVRGLERLTSFNFGTEAGRWVTWNITLPFGAAFLAFQFLWLFKYESLPRVEPAVEVVAASAEEVVVPITGNLSFFGGWNASWWFHFSWLMLGGVVLAFIRIARFRQMALGALQTGYRLIRAVIWEFPIRVWAYPPVRTLLTCGPFYLVVNYLFKPILLTALLAVAFPDLTRSLTARLLTFLVAAVLVNSRMGRAVESVLFQTITSLLNWMQALPAVVRWIYGLFREMTDALDWLLARGEDWLRLCGPGNTLSVVVRAVAGLIWFPFAFLARFYMVVLIEPMINPLKLPLSILLAKFIYPILAILGLFTLTPLGSPLVDELAPWLTWPVAWVLVIGTFYLLPDAATFLLWETRENWKLYRANRPDRLRPVAVGPSGETIGQLLHWGFHSGTVPKLYYRLRAAERTAAITDQWRDVRGYRQSLRDVEESIRRFVTRDLVAVLNPTTAWGNRILSVGHVHLGTNRIRIELQLDGQDENMAILEWCDCSGWLVAGWMEPGWVATLEEAPARAMANTLAYLYKRAGVDLVREHIRSVLPESVDHFDVSAMGLRVWFGPREAPPMVYDLARGIGDQRPRSADALSPTTGPTLSTDRLLFSRVRLTWMDWLAVWEADRTGQPLPLYGPADSDLILLPTQKTVSDADSQASGVA
ncbi:MAG: hypothetical protein LC104_15885 [Bacteroidales bacterium]|nr:hypothetical protein [Bacteroidales bacterium]